MPPLLPLLVPGLLLRSLLLTPWLTAPPHLVLLLLLLLLLPFLQLLLLSPRLLLLILRPLLQNLLLPLAVLHCQCCWC